MLGFLPIILTIAGLSAAFIAYRDIRRGGARVYSLEREAVLRQASFALFGSVSLLLISVIILYFQLNPLAGDEPAAVANTPAPDAAEIDPNATPLPEGEGGEDLIIPPVATQTPTPTLDPNVPTPTPTPILVRAFVTGTGGNGLYMRATPGGEQLIILNDDESVTVLTEEGEVEQNGFVWVKVRTFLGDEGWVARDFLEIADFN